MAEPEPEVVWNRDIDPKLLDRVRGASASRRTVQANNFPDELLSGPSVAEDGGPVVRSAICAWLDESAARPAQQPREQVAMNSDCVNPAYAEAQSDLLHALNGLRDGSEGSPASSTATSPSRNPACKKRKMDAADSPTNASQRTPLQNITNVASPSSMDVSPGFELALLAYEIPAPRAPNPPAAENPGLAAPVSACHITSAKSPRRPAHAQAAQSASDDFKFELDLSTIDFGELDAATSAASARPVNMRREVLHLVVLEVGGLEPVLPNSSYLQKAS
eukprot:tig00000852_g5052.t1